MTALESKWGPQIDAMSAMGFDREDVSVALEETNGNQQLAVDLIVKKSVWQDASRTHVFEADDTEDTYISSPSAVSASTKLVGSPAASAAAAAANTSLSPTEPKEKKANPVDAIFTFHHRTVADWIASGDKGSLPRVPDQKTLDVIVSNPQFSDKGNLTLTVVLQG